MPQEKIDTLVEEITVAQDGHDKVITLVVRYSGTVNVLQKIIEGQVLSIELPTKQPPG